MTESSGPGSYFIINIVLAAVIAAIFIYSAIFSPETNNYPVKCVHEIATGKPCPSCGLSHSFSYIVRGDLKSAALWNSNGIAVFLFFLLQLVMRISFAVAVKRNPSLSSTTQIKLDIVLSLAVFILAFYRFIIYYPSLIIG
ncbi:MAG: DUF2752 domain-containing protein [Bacteroidales bacterium]